MRKCLILTIIISLTSCYSKTNRKDKLNLENISESTDSIKISKSYENLDFAKSNTIPTDTSEFVLIDKTISVMIMPDSAWISEQQKKMGEDGWNEVVSDNQYYQSEAMDSLEKKGIQSKFFNSNKRFYKFIKKDKSFFVVDKQKMKDKWGLILFSNDKNPVFWSSTSITDAITEIYQK